MSFIASLLSIGVIFISALIGYYYYLLSFWARKNIPSPPGKLFLGNLQDFDNSKILNVVQIQKWTKEYGKTYGILEGHRPLLITSDLDLLQELFIKKFEYFHGRRLPPLIGNVDNPKNFIVNLFNSRGNRWKRLRNISNTGFNVVNLKLIQPTIQNSVNEICNHIENNLIDQEIDSYPLFQELTMDIILQIALGQTKSNIFNNLFLKEVKGFFEKRKLTKIENFLLIFPIFVIPIRILAFILQLFPVNFIMKIRKDLKKIIQKRKFERKNCLDTKTSCSVSDELKNDCFEKKRIDFIDLFLDLESDSTTFDETRNVLDKQHFKVDKKLSTNEVVAMCQVFLFAGYDTTATSIAYVVHELATHPDIQQKVQQEIDDYGVSEEPSYDDIQKLRYLDAVVKESLRLHPLAARASARECMASTTLGNISIDKGTQIIADVFSIHTNEEIWGSDAAEFNPNRWLKDEKRHQLSWIPFGSGPRTCIGMRLAYLEEKTFLITCLKKFNIVKTKNTPKNLNLFGSLVIAPENIIFKFQLRQ